MKPAKHVTQVGDRRHPIDRRRGRSRRVSSERATALGGLMLAALCGAEWGCRSDSQAAPPAPTPPEVTLSQVVERTVVDHEEFTGRTEAVHFVEVRSRVRGYLNAIHFKEGDEVQAGALLFEIDPRTFQAEVKNAEGQKAQWSAKRDKAQADVTRYEKLVPSGAASAQDLDKARAELGEALAAIQSAEAMVERAQLDLEFSRITAPIDGQVGQALITVGNLVPSDSGGSDGVLTTIVSMDPMYVYFTVNERSLLRIREQYRAGMPDGAVAPPVGELKIPAYLGLANEEGFPHTGMIDFADNQVDPGSGTLRVRAPFDNARRVFKPGLFARLQVPVSEPYQAILVSQQALGTDQGQKYVLVVNDTGVVERRFVKVGPLQDDGLQVVSAGLQAGEWIVVNGLQRARPGKPVTPQRAAMPTRAVGASAPRPTTQPAAGPHPS